MLVRATAVSLALLAPAALAPAQSSGKSDPREVRIYDVSDLPSDARIDAFTGFMPVQIDRLTPTLLVVAARAEDHEQFRSVLAQVRALAPSRIVVEATLHRVADASALDVGQAAADDLRQSPVVRRVEHAGARRTELNLVSVESRTHISDVTAIVGQNAVALDPETSEARSGMMLQLRVGDGASGVSPISIRGAITTAEINSRPMSTPNAPLQAGSDSLDLLSSTTRSIHADLSAADGRPVIAAIVDDPGAPGASLVLVVSVSPAP